MRELLRLFGQIALSRRGPQDLPAAPLLLAITIACYLAMACVSFVIVPPPMSWPGPLALDVGFTLVWYTILMRAFGKPERFLQTATAVFGYQLVIGPPLNVALTVASRVPRDSSWAAFLMILALVLFIWSMRAGTYVLRAALELPLVACIALAFAEFFASQLVQLLAFAPTPAG
jgi:hypothetical protein